MAAMYKYTAGRLHWGIQLKGWVQDELQLVFILCGAWVPLPVYLEEHCSKVATNGPCDPTTSLLSFFLYPLQCDFGAFSIQRGHALLPSNPGLSCDKTGQCRVAVCHDARPQQALLTTLDSSWSWA